MRLYERLGFVERYAFGVELSGEEGGVLRVRGMVREGVRRGEDVV